jgi:hypothetical protein
VEKCHRQAASARNKPRSISYSAERQLSKSGVKTAVDSLELNPSPVTRAMTGRLRPSKCLLAQDRGFPAANRFLRP